MRPFILPHRNATRDDEMLAAIEERLRQGSPRRPARHIDLAPSTFERIADALGSRIGFAFYCGAYVGALLTVALAYLWSWAI